MSGHAAENFPFPAKIFHELAGQLHCIPLDAVYPRYAEHFDLGQQVMKAMAELMEQRDDFVVREECLLSAQWSGKIAVQVGHGRLHARTLAPARDGIVHPGPATLRGSGIEVQIKLADQRTVA